METSRKRADADTSVRVRLAKQWPVLGRRGQLVGTAEACEIDLELGRIAYLELTTPWQTLRVDWSQVRADLTRECFRLEATRGSGQDSSA